MIKNKIHIIYNIIFFLMFYFAFNVSESIACHCECWNTNSKGPYTIYFGEATNELNCKDICESNNYGYLSCN